MKGNERAVPNLMLSNARSLANKVNELEILKGSYRADLIFVAETWLKDSVPDEIVNVSGQNIVRRDRLCGRGGGVAKYVNHDIPLKIRDDLNDQFFECLWVTIRPKWLPRSFSRIALGCVYLPPSLLTFEIDHFYDYFITCYDKLCRDGEALDIHYHISGTEIGNMFKKIEQNLCGKRENGIKCKEMIIDFRKDGTVIPAMKINDCVLERVSSYKSLGLWIDYDLKWKSNTE